MNVASVAAALVMTMTTGAWARGRRRRGGDVLWFGFGRKKRKERTSRCDFGAKLPNMNVRCRTEGRKEGRDGSRGVTHAPPAAPLHMGACGRRTSDGLAVRRRPSARAMRHLGPWKVVTTGKSSIFYGATPSSVAPSSSVPPRPANWQIADCRRRRRQIVRCASTSSKNL